jgi:hypothetical protein
MDINGEVKCGWVKSEEREENYLEVDDSKDIWCIWFEL